REPQRVWVYFRPTPIAGGLPGVGATAQELRSRLSIVIADSGGTVLGPVVVNDSVMNLDPPVGGLDGARGGRLVLMVGERSAATRELAPGPVLGMVEELVVIHITSARQLPDSVLGYDMVDAIVWLNADAEPLLAGGGERLAAIERFVRDGGRLVVCTLLERARIAPFEPWLPVEIDRMVDQSAPEPVRTLARELTLSRNPVNNTAMAGWQRIVGPFRVAVGRVKSGSIVEAWTQVPGQADRAPWLARRPMDFGCVTWVAQDLSDARLVTVADGWSGVWHFILGYRADPRVNSEANPEARNLYGVAAVRDIGAGAVSGLDVQEQSLTLVTIAIFFFIGYWALAGPGAHFFLASKKKLSWSWLVFACCALAATGLTAGVVWLVLRGPPELRHLTVVRSSAVPNSESLILSRLGVYIPRDGAQTIALDPTDRSSGWVSPLSMHPYYLQDRPGVLAPSSYVLDTAEPSKVDVPYRSTLKKLQFAWRGLLEDRISGDPRLSVTGALSGRVRNNFGVGLRNVYLVYHDPSRNDDQIIYLPAWAAGEEIDLAELRQRRDPEQRIPLVGDIASPDRGQFSVGVMGADWSRFWFPKLRSSGFGEQSFDDSSAATPAIIPLLSLFDRLPQMPNTRNNRDRVDLLRRGAREWDASAVVLGGQMLIIAQTDDAPLPVPLRVQGDPVVGRGRTIWQFAIPIDRGIPRPPTDDALPAPSGESESAPTPNP
ncbi:MAG TPA: hypothetical protein PKB10_05120, partial [Tepidisphaeraceae bacterium]|nr:hypothetical protein [Tepidisphaeraceae bacterium]